MHSINSPPDRRSPDESAARSHARLAFRCASCGLRAARDPVRKGRTSGDRAVWSGLGGDIRERLKKGEDVFGGLGETLASFYVI
jgi:hypothetical protein